MDINNVQVKKVSGWVNGYVNYLGELHFSKGYGSKSSAMKSRTKKTIQYIGEPIFIELTR